METPKKTLPSLRDDDGKYDATTTSATTSSPLRALPSPRTPVRIPRSNHSDDDDSEEMESPQYPHLIPIYQRTPDEYDIEGVRIGWDDGFGSVCYQDDDFVTDRRSKRSKSGRLFSERHHRSFFRSNHYNSSENNSPSPSRRVNHVAIQEELNNYLECILNCLSAKKKNRQLMKAKQESSSTATSSTQNDNVGCSLDDSADDEMMMLCTQAIEQKIAADTNNSTVNKPTKLIVSNSLSINGISPLKEETFNVTNNNEYYHAAKKFKPIQNKLFDEKQKNNFKSKCSHTVTSNTKNYSSSTATATITSSKKDDSSSSLLDDSLANEDDFFLGIDLSQIEQQVIADVKKPTCVSAIQKCDKQPKTNVGKQLETKPAVSSYASTSNSGSSSVLWRRSTSSSSIVNKQPQPTYQPKQFSGVGTINNSSGNAKTTDTTTITARHCTPAEIEAKRERARRTLLLKFKSKNRSIS